jgi:hypothetical protein
VQFNIPPRTKAQVPSALRASTPATISAACIDDPRKAALHRAIARHYARARHKRSRPGIVSLILRDLSIFFRDKYGKTFPDDDAGRDDLVVLLHYLAQLGDARAMRRCAARWCPWLADGEYTAMLASIDRKPLRWDADGLAREIGLDDATRTWLGITTIGATDFNKAKRTKRRTKRNTADKRVRRAEAGAKPHAMSAERLMPWLDLGISKATWNRRRKLAREAREADSGTATSILHADELASPALQGASAQADLTRSDCSAENSAGLIQSQAIEFLDQTERDAAFAGRLCFHWIKKNPFDHYPLQALTTEMGRAA